MNFDRVAEIYDATRALPEGVPERVADCIVAATHASSDTKFLELGIGTGRIALPLVKRGYPYTGVDISRRMVEQLRSKLPADTTNLELIEGDVTELPLDDNSVDVALQVHVFHLIPEWRKALTEAWRVLRPGGYFITAYDWSVRNDPGAVIRGKWQEMVREAGVTLREDAGTTRAVDAELTARGYRTAVYRVATWAVEFRPADLLREQQQRTFSASWSVPDDVLESVHEKMVTWAREEYGDIEKVIPTRFEFTVAVSR